MLDHLQDLIHGIKNLDSVDVVKVVGTDKETTINAIAEDRTVIVYGKFKNPHAEFIGTFGLPNINKLKTILSLGEYDATSSISVIKEDRDEVKNIPVSIHFETADKSFINDYRLMSKELVEERVKLPKFIGATWNVEFQPKVASIQRLKKQAQVNSEELTFIAKTENGDLKIYFGDVSSHSGNFVFESGVNGALSRAWSWPVRQFLAIMDLAGDKKVYISDQGAMRITVDTGISDYEYLIPAKTR